MIENRKIAIVPQRRNKVGNTTGFKGVIQQKSGRFTSYLQIRLPNRKNFQKTVGTFDTPEEASKARKEYIISLL